MRDWWRRVVHFLFTPENDQWVSALRIGLGLGVAFYCLSLRRDWADFFSVASLGPVKRDFAEAILSADSTWIPRVAWLVDFGGYLGLSEQTTVSTVWWLLLAGSLFLIAGLLTRGTLFLTAFLHLCVVKSSGSLSYGSDNFITIGLFYLLISPLPDRLSLDHLWRHRSTHALAGLGFVRHALQLHLCLIYFFGGLAKCAGPGWWNGDSLWRAMIRPPFNVISPDLIVTWRWLLPIAGVMVCLLETTYPIFIWPNRTRLLWLGAILAMHAVTGLLLGLYLFAFIMIVLNLAAFGPWRRVKQPDPTALMSTCGAASEKIR